MRKTVADKWPTVALKHGLEELGEWHIIVSAYGGGVANCARVVGSFASVYR